MGAAPWRHQFQVGLVIVFAKERLLTAVSPLNDVVRQARYYNPCQSRRYVHIGMEDRAEALGNLPAPKSYASVELSGMCRVWGGALSQELSSDDSDDAPDDDPENEKTPCGKGVLSSCVTDFWELPVDVSSGGGGNCTGVPGPATRFPAFVEFDPTNMYGRP